MIHKKTSTIQKQCHVEAIEKPTFSAELFIPSGIQLIDRLIGGFKAGDVTYVYGESPIIHHFPYHLCTNTYMMFRENSVFLDGGSSINPYTIARYAKMYEMNPGEVLKHVYVSRAFTIYQLSSLIQDHLEPLINEHKPQTLILDAFPILYNDSDVIFDEAYTLFNETIQKINNLTKRYHLVTLITNPMNHWMQSESHATLHQSLFTTSHELICIKQMKHCPRIWLPYHQHATTVTSGVNGQLCLQDFGMVFS